MSLAEQKYDLALVNTKSDKKIQQRPWYVLLCCVFMNPFNYKLEILHYITQTAHCWDKRKKGNVGRCAGKDYSPAPVAGGHFFKFQNHILFSIP